MIKYIKQWVYLIGSVILPSVSFAQNIINLSAPETGTQDHRAKIEVNAHAGYEYSPTGNNFAHLWVDPNDVVIDNYANYQQPLPITDFSNTHINQNLEVGAIKGLASVGADGSSSYTIALNIPKGTAGMEPTLSLNYNSRNGNGLLGFGWNFSGLSFITREQQDYYHDNTIKPVSYSNSDPFSLDGNRLIPITGNNGENGTTYGLEIENFSRITSIASANNEPDWFKVETKGGLTLEYGNDSYAKVSNADGNTLIWYLNKMYDLNGNYVEYKYKFINDQKVLDQIIYTGNIYAGLSPYNKIQFDYAIRSDSNCVFGRSQKMLDGLVLEKIRVLTHNQIYRQYELEYTNKDAGNTMIRYINNTFLQEIKERGNNPTDYYNSTIFKYVDVQRPLTYNVSSASLPSASHSEYITDDFNGDGYSDFVEFEKPNTSVGNVFFQNTGMSIYQNTHYATFTQYYSTTNLPPNEEIHTFNYQPYDKTSFGKAKYLSSDFDGDGFEDLCVITKSMNSFHVNILKNNTSTIGGTIQFTNQNQLSIPIQIVVNIPAGPVTYYADEIETRIGDFDGDTKADLMLIHLYGTGILGTKTINGKIDSTVYFSNAEVKLFLNNNFTSVSATHLYTFSSSTGNYISFKNSYVSDLNGDGVSELMGVENSTQHFYTLSSTTSAGVTNINTTTEPTFNVGSTTFYYSEPNFKNIGDFNGDGISDELFGFTDAGHFKYFVAYGKGNYNSTGSFNFYVKQISEETHPGDPGGMPPNLNLGLKMPSENTLGDWTKSNSGHITADINGDGKTDIIEITSYLDGNYVAQTFTLYMSTGIGFNQTPLMKNDNSFLAYDSGVNLGDFDGDGSLELFMYRMRNINNQQIEVSANTIMYFNLAPKKRLLELVMNGLGQQSNFLYTKLNDPYNFYTPGTGENFPMMDFEGTTNIVSGLKISNGTSSMGVPGTNDLYYRYEGAKIHRQGKGLLGFLTTTITEGGGSVQAPQVTIEKNYLDENAFILLPLSTETKSSPPNSNSVSKTEPVTLAISLGSHRFKIQTNSVHTNDYLKDATTNTLYQYDTYGNITDVQSNLNNSLETSQTSIIYAQPPYGTWIPSSPISIIETKTRLTEPAVVRKTNLAYDNYNRVTDVWDYVTDPKTLNTHFDNDVFGNVVQSTVTTQTTQTTPSSRTTHCQYDNEGRFIINSYNELNQLTTNTIHPVWGSSTKIKGINGLETNFVYNGFGRLTSTITPDGITTSKDILWALQSGITDATYKTITTRTGQPNQKIYYSCGGLEMQTETESYASTSLLTQNEYYPNGLLHIKTGTSGIVTSYTYDEFRRITDENNNSLGNNNHTQYTYPAPQNGQSFAVITPPDNNQVISKTFDASGKLTKSANASGDVDYNYNSMGLVKNTSVLGVVMESMEYDNMGYRKLLSDKNAGDLLSERDGFGQLTSQTDGNLNNFTFAYDALGRNTMRTGLDGITSYSYFNTGPAINAVHTVTGPTGANQLIQNYSYDNLGRTTLFNETDVSTGQSYPTTYSYNANGNITELTYPSGFGIKKEYDSKGFLTDVRKAADNSLIYHLNAMNNLEQITDYSFGNNLEVVHKTYDAMGYLEHITGQLQTNTFIQDLELNWNKTNGNLNWRNDNTQSPLLHEVFSYDNLNRLTQSTVTGLATVNMAYQPNGNIDSKTDAGNYTYDLNKINAVVSVSNPLANINMQTQSVTYNPYKLPSQIEEGNNLLNLTYGPDGRRFKTELSASGQVQYTRYFVLGYEKNITPTSTQELHYINCGDGIGAIFVKDNMIGEHLYYVHKDHLGTLLKLIDENGNVVANQNFDAWGRYRNPTTWDYANIPANPPWLFRGFTGHEHLQEFSIINMNGRCYDPTIARMFNPDELVQRDEDTQGFNRYSYVWNNPLKYADPSGMGGTNGSSGEDGWDNPNNGVAYQPGNVGPSNTSSFVVPFATNSTGGGGNPFQVTESGGGAGGSSSAYVDGNGFVAVNNIQPSSTPARSERSNAEHYENMTTKDITSVSTPDENSDGGNGSWNAGSNVICMYGPPSIVASSDVNQGTPASEEGSFNSGTWAGHATVPGGKGSWVSQHAQSGGGMKPASSYDYSQDVIPGKFTDDWNYITNGSGGNPFSRAANIFSRDWGQASTSDKAGLVLAGVPLLRIGKIVVPAQTFHRFIKPDILKAAGNGFEKIVGRNPDIFIDKGQIILRGTGPFKGKSFPTGLDPTDFFH